ncbi:MAG TPA: ATP-binding protein [Polyangiaceae bacterium]|nr:ATP-binding protein [Polyangiaceae bacterium]
MPTLANPPPAKGAAVTEGAEPARAVRWRSIVAAFVAFALFLFVSVSALVFLLATRSSFALTTAGSADASREILTTSMVGGGVASFLFLGFGLFYVRSALRAAESALLQQEKKALEAMESTRKKSELLAAASHEIRTPMSGIIGLSELLRRTELGPTQSRYAETIQSSANALLRVLNDVLDLSKIEAEKFSIVPTEIDPRRIAEEVGELLAPGAREKGVEVSVRIAEDVPDRVVADGDRLRQVLVNLAGNAVKFTDRGEVVIRARIAGSAAERPLLRFEVSDTGVGVSVADRARLFQAFSQVNDSTRRGGAGLGLAISRELVRLMDGDIGVESEEGKGSTFWFSIPVRVDAVPASPSAGAASSPVRVPPIGDGTARPRVLVAEDDPVHREVLEELLASLGVDSRVVSDGEEFLAEVERGAYPLVLVDCEMPRLDGYQAARAIRARETLEAHRARLPIVAVSAHALEGEREKALDAGMDDYVTKPVTSEALGAVLRKYLPGAGEGADPSPIGEMPALGPSPLDPKVRRTVRVTEVFLTHAPEQVEEVVRAVERKDAAALKAAAHKLKGGCIGLGIPGMAELCAALEPNPPNAGELAARLEDEFSRVESALEDELDRANVTSP